ncbi:MAG TPA: alpha/beta hydrolase-fold protein [Streptosporangiaceae bacterium]|nr:alpha/beta hydrolase-fold protein [Streptosporangiaceae bacterium]
MTRTLTRKPKSRVTWSLRLLAFCSLLVPLLASPHKAFAETASDPVTASDDFNRANGSLGPNWTDISDGGLAISSDAAAGTAAAGLSGDVWTADSFTSDQYSQVQVTSTQLTGGQWIGPAVRAQDSGQEAYVGIYNWNNGSPDLMLFKRNGGTWTQLGSYNSGPLAAGTQLEVTAAGSIISFLENGVQRITATDTSLTGGAPGIISFGTGQVGSWSGGDAPTTYTIGGTVSGLTGTVVLQDNGGDNLSVSANGTFTFATPLADGTAYSVTVRTYPSGQTCTASNASGTISAANVTNVAVACTSGTQASSASDDFNRANGSLGPNWTDISDGGLAISSQAVVGTSSGLTGDIRTDGVYASDQYSQIEVTSTQLTGSQWIGAAVRVQDGGQEAYAGIYNWNNGSPDLTIFERNGGTWTQLGSTYNSAPLAAGTQLKLMVVGSTIAFMENGVQRIAVGDTSLAGGAPGIMIDGTGQADNWSGGTASFEVHYLSTDSSGVASYDVISANDSDGPQVLRVLKPTNPAPGVPHNFLYVLPVEAGLGSSDGDGLETLLSLDAQDKYNLTIIEPSFGIDPWYADNPVNPAVQYETFMTKELVPWVQQNLATTGSEQNWLIGFSKSGIGGQDLLLKHPDIFTLAASWDFPADMSSYDQFGADSGAGYGTDANFQANYRLTQAFVDARKGPFLNSNRIWIGGYSQFQNDISDYDELLTSEGIAHSTETPTNMSHSWGSGWVPLALAGLSQESANLSN